MDKNSNVIKIAKTETLDEIKFQMTLKVLISLYVLIHV